MFFKINNVLIWPKNSENELVNIEFDLNKVNIITGGSSRGKSAIISIIDYCLGSGVCRIPTNTIRNKSAWFGIIVTLKDGSQILLARKEPGLERISNDMYFKEDQKIEIPQLVESNVNVSQVKDRLDRLAGLTRFNFTDEEEDGFQSRPSFRDLVALNFQPQHIVANRSTLFFKTDEFQHREKLRTIFPYLLGAVSDSYLRDRDTLKELKRDLISLESDLAKRKKMVERWISELRSTYIKAKEFGLVDGPFPEDDWTAQVYIAYLNQVEIEFEDKIPTIPVGISNQVANEVAKLEKQEIEQSHELFNLKHRYELIKKLEDSNREYRDELLNQRNRLKSVSWFNDHLKNKESCPICGSSDEKIHASVEDLVNANSEILGQGAVNNDNFIALSAETSRLKKEIKGFENSINNTRKEISIIKSSDNISEKRYQNLFSIYRFAGNLQAEIKNYIEFTENSDLTNWIAELRKNIVEIESRTNSEGVQTRLNRSRKLVSDLIKNYAKILNTEYCNDVIRFDENNLTLNFLTEDGRSNALYEIGGGANYMGYHISTLIAIHEFLKGLKSTSPIPSFLIFDQPSQVYFPDRNDNENTDQEDVERVKSIFKVLSDAFENNGSELQIIVLEHVGDYAWEGLENVKMLKRWRGEEPDAYLIPLDWK